MKEEEKRFRVAPISFPDDAAYTEQIALTEEKAVEAFVRSTSAVPNDEWRSFSVLDEYDNLTTVDVERDDDDLNVSVSVSAQSPLRSYLVSEWNDDQELMLDGRSVDEVARQGGERFCKEPRPLLLRIIPEGGEYTLHYKVQILPGGSTQVLSVLTEEEADADLRQKKD